MTPLKLPGPIRKFPLRSVVRSLKFSAERHAGQVTGMMGYGDPGIIVNAPVVWLILNALITPVVFVLLTNTLLYRYLPLGSIAIATFPPPVRNGDPGTGVNEPSLNTEKATMPDGPQ